MREIETDYLVVGAGASGMAFVDALTASSDADVVMVDRRHRPGGHWLDAYPFVRLHQPSACYGVNSRALGDDRIDESGPNAGFYERATAAEICDYFNRVLEEDMLPSGRVRFFGMCDYRADGPDGHHFVSTLTGETTSVKVRRKLVDATYIETSVPSRHTPAFGVDDGVRLIPPNDLVDLSGPATGYTVIGAGKTSMDTCCWLIEQGVAPDALRWIRPRDGWVLNRAFMQPLEMVGSLMEFQSRLVEAAAEATSATGLMERMAEHDIFIRIDPDVEPEVFRGAILDTREIGSLRKIGNLVRQGRVLRIGTGRITLERGEIDADPGHVYVDCTATGLNPAPPRPIYESRRVTPQLVTLGIIPWSAALIGYVEAAHGDDEEKNRLCVPVGMPNAVSGMPETIYVILSSLGARMADPDVAAWNENSRLNPARGAMGRMDDPHIQEAFARFGTYLGPALENLERLVARG